MVRLVCWCVGRLLLGVSWLAHGGRLRLAVLTVTSSQVVEGSSHPGAGRRGCVGHASRALLASTASAAVLLSPARVGVLAGGLPVVVPGVVVVVSTVVVALVGVVGHLEAGVVAVVALTVARLAEPSLARVRLWLPGLTSFLDPVHHPSPAPPPGLVSVVATATGRLLFEPGLEEAGRVREHPKV